MCRVRCWKSSSRASSRKPVLTSREDIRQLAGRLIAGKTDVRWDEDGAPDVTITFSDSDVEALTEALDNFVEQGTDRERVAQDGPPRSQEAQEELAGTSALGRANPGRIRSPPCPPLRQKGSICSECSSLFPVSSEKKPMPKQGDRAQGAAATARTFC